MARDQRATSSRPSARPTLRRIVAALGASVTVLVTCWAIPATANNSQILAVHGPSNATLFGHPPLAPPTTLITLLAPTAGYRVPNGPQTMTVQPTFMGTWLTMPVIAESDGFYNIRLATRPNESTTWVRASDVLVSATQYRIVINLTTTHLQLQRLGVTVLDAPVGVGSPAYPTPTGNYFVAFYADGPGAGFGPSILVTSAHSDKITDWEGTGDANIGIHGPIGTDAAIGTTGARISHGCIRMHLADQLQLLNVPDGTPIIITN